MTYHTETLPSGFTVDIEYDTDPINPVKDYDMVGKLVLIDRCRYNFGHESASYEELKAIARNPDNIVLQVYMYDHSGITINTVGFSCPWDSGVVGLIYCTKKQAVKEWGKKLCTKTVIDKALACMVSEVETIDQYLTGECYGFIVKDPDGEEVDSCWGFLGDYEYCLEEGMSSARYHESKWLDERRQNWRKALHEARERRYWAQRDVGTGNIINVQA